MDARKIRIFTLSEHRSSDSDAEGAPGIFRHDGYSAHIAARTAIICDAGVEIEGLWASDSGRVLKAEVTVNRDQKARIVSVYAFTMQASEEELDIF